MSSSDIILFYAKRKVVSYGIDMRVVSTRSVLHDNLLDSKTFVALFLQNCVTNLDSHAGKTGKYYITYMYITDTCRNHVYFYM